MRFIGCARGAWLWGQIYALALPFVCLYVLHGPSIERCTIAAPPTGAIIAAPNAHREPHDLVAERSYARSGRNRALASSAGRALQKAARSSGAVRAVGARAGPTASGHRDRRSPRSYSAHHRHLAHAWY